ARPVQRTTPSLSTARPIANPQTILKKLHAKILAASLLLNFAALVFNSAAAPGDVDLSFDPGSGVNNVVRTVAVQSDDKVLMGGDFTTVKGLARNRIARLNADGTADDT